MQTAHAPRTFDFLHFEVLSRKQMVSRITFFVFMLGALVTIVVSAIEPVALINNTFPGFLANRRLVLSRYELFHWTGMQAGLRFPAKLVQVNDKKISSFEDLANIVKSHPVGTPIKYTVEKDKKTLEFTVPSMTFSLGEFLQIYGFAFFPALVFLLIGVGVFIARPDTLASWVFLSLCTVLSIYNFASYGSVRYGVVMISILSRSLYPAVLLHLALVFPEQKRFIAKFPFLQVVPYLISASLAIPMVQYYPTPAWLPYYDKNVTYIFVAMVGFVLFIIPTYVTASAVARQRAKILLIGSALAFPLPAVNFLSTHFGLALLGGIRIPTNYMQMFSLFFPAAVAIAIARSDLFAIDIIIQRTYGYLLSTGAIVGVYALLVTVLNATFQSAEIASSPWFSLAFALGVVLFFNPLHRRFQGFIDRVFYRQQYDYRTTIRDVSETMIRILDPAQIHHTLIGAVSKEMFLENGVVLLPSPEEPVYRARAVEGVEGEAAARLGEVSLPADHALVRLFEENSDAIFRYDIELNPVYAPQREALQDAFQACAAEVMLPLKYKDAMRGIISLGRKKSGKIFTPEDLDLLRTLASQSAIALENATLFAENLEKGRMEEELKIAHDIQTSMLPQRAPKLPGVTIAASSFSAREVGGDFYDFIEIDRDAADKQVAIVVGDVSGKAVSGALVMAAARSVFRVLAESHSSVQEVMTVGNACLNRDIKKGMFVALVYAVLDPARKVMTLANAGQTAPIVCPGDLSAPAYIETQGDKFPLGILRKARYEETQVPLHPGDTLVFYTDGIVEAMNAQEELYGFERFMAAIEAGRSLDAKALLARLMQDVEGFVGAAEQHDDLTIVVAQVE